MNKAETLAGIAEQVARLTEFFTTLGGGTPTVEFIRSEKAGPVLRVTHEPGEIANAIRVQRWVKSMGDAIMEPAHAAQEKPTFLYQMIAL